MEVDDLITVAKVIGGQTLVGKVVKVAAAHGPDVAKSLVETVSKSADLRRAYKFRSSAIAKAEEVGDDRVAVGITQTVNAAENAVINQLVKGKRAKVPERVGMRDVDGVGGWKYRQFADGVIVILGAPSANASAKNTVLRSGNAWAAITKEIGPFPIERVTALPTKMTAVAVAQALRKTPTKQLRETEKTLIRKALRAGAATAAPKVAAKLGVKLVGGAASTSAGAGAVNALLAAAGVSATAPVVGWIAAGGLALAAGTIALVRVGRNRRQVLAQAKQMGIPDAEELPGFTARTLRMSSAKRQRRGARLAKVLGSAQGRHVSLRNKQKLQAKLRILAAVELTQRAQRRRGSKTQSRSRGLGNVVDMEGNPVGAIAAPDAASPNLSAYDVVGLAGNFGAVDPDELKERLLRAAAGNVTDGGVISPREAAAYVFGYVVRRYIPARKAQGKITDSQIKKIIILATQFQTATAAPDDATAIKMVLAIGKDSDVLDTVKGTLGTVFDQFTTSDPGRKWGIEVLRHGAALMAMANEPLAAAKLSVAAAGSSKVEAGILSAIGTGVTDLLAEAKDKIEEAAAAPTKIAATIKAEGEKLAAGAINLVVKTEEAAKDRAVAAVKAVDEAADKLETVGTSVVKALVVEAKDKAKALVEAPAAAQKAIAKSINDTGAKLKDQVEALKASADARIADMARDFEDRLDTALDAARSARSAAAAVPEAIAAAVKAEVAKLGKLSKAAADKISDPKELCKLLPGSAGDACRKFAETEDKCDLLPLTTQRFACKRPGTTFGILLGVPAVLAVALLFGSFRAQAVAAKASVQAATKLL